MTPTEWKESQLEVPKIGCVSHDCGYCQPKREWVGLTDEEIEAEWDKFMSGASDGYVPTFVKSIEAKLKEKNT